MGKHFLLVAISLGLCSAINAGLTDDLKQHIAAAPNDVHRGFYVQSMTNNRVLFAKNAKHLFTPASIMKILPAVASLKYLGPDYRFPTRLAVTAKPKRGVINGDVYIIFSGDPDFTSSDLSKLVKKLKQKGVTRINGHVYLDNHAYDTHYHPPGRVVDDTAYYYSAPISTISIDQNNFAMRIRPGTKLGAKAKLEPLLPNGIVTLDNHVLTAPHSSIIKIYAKPNNHYYLQGKLSQKTKQISRRMALTNPVPLAARLVATDLKENGIPFTGRVNVKTAPSKQLYTLSEHYSKPLKTLVKQMLTDSDNHIADSLVKKLGERYYKTQGTWDNGVKAMETILHQYTGVNFKKNHFTDGSGLSRYDLITPEQIGKILAFAYKDKAIYKYFYAALPVAGKTGTLAWRMKNHPRARFIRAKTGSMGGVTSLAGYAKSRSGHTRAFVFMTNGYVDKRKVHSKLEDKLATQLAS